MLAPGEKVRLVGDIAEKLMDKFPEPSDIARFLEDCNIEYDPIISHQDTKTGIEQSLLKVNDDYLIKIANKLGLNARIK